MEVVVAVESRVEPSAGIVSAKLQNWITGPMLKEDALYRVSELANGIAICTASRTGAGGKPTVNTARPRANASLVIWRWHTQWKSQRLYQ